MYIETYLNGELLNRYDASLFELFDHSGQMDFSTMEERFKYRGELSELFVEKVKDAQGDDSVKPDQMYIYFPSKLNF